MVRKWRLKKNGRKEGENELIKWNNWIPKKEDEKWKKENLGENEKRVRIVEGKN